MGHHTVPVDMAETYAVETALDRRDEIAWCAELELSHKRSGSRYGFTSQRNAE